jgi:hypothetical protein
LEALSQASAQGDFATLNTRVNPGDHTNRLSEEFADAVRFLTAAAATAAEAKP